MSWDRFFIVAFFVMVGLFALMLLAILGAVVFCQFVDCTALRR